MVSYICSVTHCSGARADGEVGFAWLLMRAAEHWTLMRAAKHSTRMRAAKHSTRMRAAEHRSDLRLRGHLEGMLRGTRLRC